MPSNAYKHGRTGVADGGLSCLEAMETLSKQEQMQRERALWARALDAKRWSQIQRLKWA
jgi:hypothetical protein